MIENENIAKTGAKAIVDEGLRSYMMKVYNFMAGGLIITALAAFLVANTPLIRLFFTQTGLSPLGWLILFAPVISIFGFGWVISKGTLRQLQVCFFGFSVLMGLSLSPILLAYTGASVTRIFLITAAMFGGMSLYGYTTKRDLTGIGSFLIMGFWGLFIALIVNLVMQSSALSYVLSIIGVFIFTGLAAYDTQKIRSMYSYARDEDSLTRIAVSGALALYVDFINLFLSLLRLFGDRR